MWNKLKKYFLFVIQRRTVQHFLFWLISFRILLEIFANSKDFLRIDFIYTGVFISTIMLPVYINLRILIPKILTGNKYFLFGILFLLLLTSSVLINYVTFNSLIDYIFPGYYFISFYEFIDIAKFMLVFMLLTSLLKLSKSWFILTETKKKLSQIEAEKYRNELLALRTQINPHFIFNSLNNIYSLAINKSDMAPDALIKLSNIMRYVIYEGSADRVNLNDEVNILKEYIELQNLRAKDSKINFISNIKNSKARLAPLIFLPIVENGYKHGIKGDVKNAYLNIELKESDGIIVFITINNKGSVENIEKDTGKGIGLENVKRRLELIYPGNHEFRIFDEVNRFVVEIQIQYGKDD
ncbi:MAG: sensor histidine kinase [Bacteroidales bacterium]|nr:sensor histidine kinase [Bacteroidales bacterium]